MQGDVARQATFGQSLRGYHIDDVDTFLAQLADVLDRGDPTDALIDGARFRQTLRGYTISDVDTFLGNLRTGGAASLGARRDER